MGSPRCVIYGTVLGFCLTVSCSSYLFGDVSSPDGKLTLKGTAVLHGSTPAANAYIESLVPGVTETIRTRADEQGRFQLSDLFRYGVWLQVRSADETQQATLQVSASDARTRLAKPLEFKLTPAEEQIVTVLSSSGQPVAGVHVKAEGRVYRSAGVTGTDGKAKFRLSPGEELLALVAWHPTLGVAGRENFLDGLKNDSFQLKLLPTAPHTIRFLAADGQPVPSFPFRVGLGTKAKDGIRTGDIEAAWLRTDAKGEVTVPWFPKELQSVSVLMSDDGWKIDKTEKDKMAEGLTTVRVRRKIAVAGRLRMPVGVGAEGILVSGPGFPPDSGPRFQTDDVKARAAADGSFTLLVVPDHGYALHIADSEWASDGWSGLILAAEYAKPAEIVMDVYAATPLQVRVTRGEDHQQIAGARILLRSEQKLAWRDSHGANRRAFGGRQELVSTGPDGIAHFSIGRGNQKLQLSSGNWTEEKTITVDSNSPVSVEFFREWLKDRTISGKLIANNSPHRPSPTATIVVASMKPGRQRFPLTALLQPDGAFSVTGDATDVSILVIDREQRLSGFARTSPNESSTELALSPMASCAGTIVDQKGQPHIGKTLRIVVKGTDHLAAEDQISDAEGRVKFPLVAANVPLTLLIQQQSERGLIFRPAGTLLLTPGESRENARFSIDLRDLNQRKAQADEAPLAQRLANTARNARLGGMHALAILQGDSSEKVTRMVETISHYENQPSILAYLPLVVDDKTIQSNAATLKQLGWQLPQSGQVVLVALDGDAKLLGMERLVVGGVDAVATLTTALLKKHLPPIRDAQASLSAAQEEAKRTDRRVWIVLGGPRCGPCFQLARWMEEQHALLEKDFVIAKVMDGLDHHAEGVVKALDPPQGSGIPWYAITEADGRVLTTSDSLLGNIGMPSSPEGIVHIHEMLKHAAKRLTAEDLDHLTESLAAFK